MPRPRDNPLGVGGVLLTLVGLGLVGVSVYEIATGGVTRALSPSKPAAPPLPVPVQPPLVAAALPPAPTPPPAPPPKSASPPPAPSPASKPPSLAVPTAGQIKAEGQALFGTPPAPPVADADASSDDTSDGDAS